MAMSGMLKSFAAAMPATTSPIFCPAWPAPRSAAWLNAPLTVPVHTSSRLLPKTPAVPRPTKVSAAASFAAPNTTDFATPGFHFAIPMWPPLIRPPAAAPATNSINVLSPSHWTRLPSANWISCAIAPCTTSSTPSCTASASNRRTQCSFSRMRVTATRAAVMNDGTKGAVNGLDSAHTMDEANHTISIIIE